MLAHAEGAEVVIESVPRRDANTTPTAFPNNSHLPPQHRPGTKWKPGKGACKHTPYKITHPRTQKYQLRASYDFASWSVLGWYLLQEADVVEDDFGADPSSYAIEAADERGQWSESTAVACQVGEGTFDGDSLS